MLTLKGQQGKTVVVERGSIRMTKQGCVLAPPRQRTIPVRQVTAVEVRKPGGVFAGFIRFVTADEVALDGALGLSGRAFDPTKDENSVVFADEASYETALQIKDYVEGFGSAPG